MPRIVRELEALEVRRLTKPGYHAVGGVSGLLLRVTKTGARSWILRAMVGSRRRDIGLGGYPDTTLAQARERARNAKAMIREGIDPVEERRKAQAALKAEQARLKTFAEVWEEYRDAKLVGVTKKTRQHWINSIKRYALPVIGSSVVSEITKTDVERVLLPIWTTKPVMGRKLRQRIERILGFATGKEYRSGDNPAKWKDNLDDILPDTSEVHRVQHFRALPHDDAPEFMELLRQRKGNAARALEFAILTAARSGEVRGATWDEIDLKRKRWTIPAERMKMDKDHTVPLSDAALAVLKGMARDSELIFPAPRGGKLSDMSLLAVIKRMNWNDRTTVHGFRSVFKDWATEETDTQDFISEIALAHSVGDEVYRAYKRSDLVAKRRRLMREWSQFLGYEEKGGQVVQMEAIA